MKSLFHAGTAQDRRREPVRVAQKATHHRQPRCLQSQDQAATPLDHQPDAEALCRCA